MTFGAAMFAALAVWIGLTGWYCGRRGCDTLPESERSFGAGVLALAAGAILAFAWWRYRVLSEGQGRNR
jgi:hypothetical protein